MDKNHRGLELVRVIVSMAKELGMEAIAEGIETNKQLNDLQEMYCGFGQGFLLSKPFEPGALEKVLATLSKGQIQQEQNILVADILTSDPG